MGVGGPLNFCDGPIMEFLILGVTLRVLGLYWAWLFGLETWAWRFWGDQELQPDYQTCIRQGQIMLC